MIPIPDVGEPAAECRDSQTTSLPTGHMLVVDPVGKDQPDNVPCPTSTSNRTNSHKRNEFESIGGQHIAVPADFDEKA